MTPALRVGRYINEVCELLDIDVLTDIEEVGNESNPKIKPVVALGWHGEPAAGIRYGVVTRWFNNEEELDEFCELNIERFRTAAEECENGAAIPDASDWR
jgi:hypothetical protein